MNSRGRESLKSQDVLEMVNKADRREKGVRRGSLKRAQHPRNNFPFTPVKEGRDNPFHLTLDKWDCRIANGVQEHGFLPVVEFCKIVKVPVPKFYQRLRDNPDLVEALKLLALGSRVLAYPKAMNVLSEKFSENPGWAKLWLQVNGLLDEPSIRLVKKEEEDTERPLMTTEQIHLLIEGAKR